MTDQHDRLKTALADRYSIEREIGSGGMATVYLARDIRHERNVAVKVLRPELASALGPDRFLREIRIAANLHHPHILPLYDSGEADGFLYYVMPYEEGQSLRDKLAKEGELPIAEAVRILRDVVDALAHAHEQGVVHRDIKPDNVLLSGRHALVTDFGVAKAVSEATGRDKLTTAGIALGTPAYMAPEQATADEHIDHRADIYAVGALAYELFAGRPPFLGTTPQMVLSAHVTQHAEPVTKYRDTVPAALDQIVMKCLEKKAADRWQTADELLPQFEALATPSGGMTPTGTQPVVATSVKRTRIWAVAGAVVVIALGAAAVLLWPGKSLPRSHWQ
jgi:serine/threonine-protein kinase